MTAEVSSSFLGGDASKSYPSVILTRQHQANVILEESYSSIKLACNRLKIREGEKQNVSGHHLLPQ